MDYPFPSTFPFLPYAANKRHKSDHVARRSYANNTEDLELAEDAEGDVDQEIWSNNALFALDTPHAAPFRPTNNPEMSNKRSK